MNLLQFVRKGNSGETSLQADQKRALNSLSSLPGNKGIVPGVVLPEYMSLHSNGKGPARPTRAMFFSSAGGSGVIFCSLTVPVLHQVQALCNSCRRLTGSIIAIYIFVKRLLCFYDTREYAFWQDIKTPFTGFSFLRFVQPVSARILVVAGRRRELELSLHPYFAHVRSRL